MEQVSRPLNLPLKAPVLVKHVVEFVTSLVGKEAFTAGYVEYRNQLLRIATIVTVLWADCLTLVQLRCENGANRHFILL